MGILTILTYPDPILKTKSNPVERFDSELEALVNDMIETMYAAPGVGLAAIQVGIPQRIIVIDITYEKDDTGEIRNKNPLILINPEIIEKTGTYVYQEGCLSLPGLYEDVKRAQDIKVRFQDTSGKQHELQASELLAVAIQHENDHLEGVLFVDRLSFLKAKRARKKYLNAKVE